LLTLNEGVVSHANRLLFVKENNNSDR
jgi:hypothetical protein